MGCANGFVGPDLHNPVFEGEGRKRLFLPRGYFKAKCELMWCRNGSPGVCSQKTKRVVLIPEEQGRGTLLPPSESLFSFHEKCLQGNHRWITGSSSHGNVVFYLNKPFGLNAALGGAKLVWFEDGAGGSKCSEW